MAAPKLIVAGLCCATLLLLHPASGQTGGQSPEKASISFIHTYMEEWSSPNPVALAYMNGVFSNEAVYFDQTLSHDALMQAKRRFAERWPIRRFVVRPDDLSVVCDRQSLCSVWGLVDWQCQNPERHADAVGTSVFDFQLQDGRTVISEDGFVVARGRILPRRVSARPTSPVTYSNAEIPRLRRAFYDGSADRDWINAWLSAARRFDGTARSPGRAGLRELPASNGSAIHYAVFQADEGPIGCVMSEDEPLPPPGAEVRLHGKVSIFIENTMYLSDCSFR